MGQVEPTINETASPAARTFVTRRMELLEPTETVRHCPCKGSAKYWSLQVGDKTYRDFVWAYPRPIPEILKIENLLCFYNEKVGLYVDGVKRERAVSPFS